MSSSPVSPPDQENEQSHTPTQIRPVRRPPKQETEEDPKPLEPLPIHLERLRDVISSLTQALSTMNQDLSNVVNSLKRQIKILIKRFQREWEIASGFITNIHRKTTVEGRMIQGLRTVYEEFDDRIHEELRRTLRVLDGEEE